MSNSIPQPPTPFAPLTDETARKLLRENQLRCTGCRLAVLKHLASQGSPQSHAEVVEALKASGFDKSTIYRCLIDLTDAGLLLRMELGDHVWRFELRRAQRPTAEHPHFICVDCGEVACLPDVQIQIDQKTDDPIPLGEVTEILLKGRCHACR